MPPLIRYIILRLVTGFAIGCACALALILGPLKDYPMPAGGLAAWLMIYGVASTFALGFLATALAMDGED
ncbi:hypothetical protein CYG48_10445 [Neorhizobium sp. SOG26]|uniref:hypothetical protein n=1 Tax=Neorhizobium sp. SOG26 TaxID=2060726 RepID=UPI000E583B3E|nr:hypothetical protein [Neorhizobium sp. SOG26]AXV16074.1 hypothetical protein CYG48_10445 [Neorhizobium sp. SOG26]